jgi:hypothetical protein
MKVIGGDRRVHLNIACLEFAVMSWRLLEYVKDSISLITTEEKLPVSLGYSPGCPRMLPTQREEKKS